jgi:hypothetical protein
VLFSQVVGPLATLLPGRRFLARALFSAVQGVVVLSLEDKLVSLPLLDLREHVTAIVRAVGNGRDEFCGDGKRSVPFTK